VRHAYDMVIEVLDDDFVANITAESCGETISLPLDAMLASVFYHNG